ncbi:MAG: RecQ family ATP-dependent DNA helicase, partial [Candidatus Hydrogenedentes bacterium]|nr:RecQ family ATP-dependent DNA helicase [Candidatus Hydrogenedentota bacterium]
MQRILSALQQYWGYNAFRPLQQEAMASVLTGRDSVTILPTGGGKSLCFQAPAIAMEGMAVVVSPLIALMKDQVDALNACGVPAAYINSTITNEQRYATDAAIREGRLKLVYVTPERLAKPAFIEYLRRFKIAFIAVDEAHCISMWGHDFRPEYRQLKELKERFPGIALHAYTATATPQVRDDIVQELNLATPDVHVGNFDRPNLIYRVPRRSDLPTQII